MATIVIPIDMPTSTTQANNRQRRLGPCCMGLNIDSQPVVGRDGLNRQHLVDAFQYGLLLGRECSPDGVNGLPDHG